MSSSRDLPDDLLEELARRDNPEYAEVPTENSIDPFSNFVDPFKSKPKKTSAKKSKKSAEEKKPSKTIVEKTEQPQESPLGIEVYDNPESSTEEDTNPVEEDNFYNLIRGGHTTSEVVEGALGEIAEELAYLRKYRNTLYKTKADFSMVSEKRVKAIKSAVELIVLKKGLLENSDKKGDLDLSGEPFKKVFKLLLSKVSATLDNVKVPGDLKDKFFIMLSQELDNFDRDARKILGDNT
jgi:hypothetical protein